MYMYHSKVYPAVPANSRKQIKHSNFILHWNRNVNPEWDSITNTSEYIIKKKFVFFLTGNTVMLLGMLKYAQGARVVADTAQTTPTAVGENDKKTN